jgi:hypothetical protein
LKYVSFFYYAYDAVNIKLWQDYGHIECIPPKSYIPTILANGTVCPNPLCFVDGKNVLEQYGFDKVRKK